MTEDDTFRILKRKPFSEVDRWIRHEVAVGNVNNFDEDKINKHLKDTGWTWKELREYSKNE